MASNNANPVTNIGRYWEVIDLITTAMTYQDGPIRWEGKHYASARHQRAAGHGGGRIRACGRQPVIRRQRARLAGAGHGQRPGPARWRRRRGEAWAAYRRGADGGRAAHSQYRPLRVCGLRLCRRHSPGGRRVGGQLHVVRQHEPQVGAPRTRSFCLVQGVHATIRATDLSRCTADTRISGTNE